MDAENRYDIQTVHAATMTDKHLLVAWHEELARYEDEEEEKSVPCAICHKPTGISPVVLAAMGAVRATHPGCNPIDDPVSDTRRKKNHGR